MPRGISQVLPLCLVFWILFASVETLLHCWWWNQGEGFCECICIHWSSRLVVVNLTTAATCKLQRSKAESTKKRLKSMTANDSELQTMTWICTFAILNEVQARNFLPWLGSSVAKTATCFTNLKQTALAQSSFIGDSSILKIQAKQAIFTRSFQLSSVASVLCMLDMCRWETRPRLRHPRRTLVFSSNVEWKLWILDWWQTALANI